jgi:hypothetical protein
MAHFQVSNAGVNAEFSTQVETKRLQRTLKPVFRIRIRIDFGRLDPDPYTREGKNGPKILKKVTKYHVLKCWMFSFEISRLLMWDKYCNL